MPDRTPTLDEWVTENGGLSVPVRKLGGPVWSAILEAAGPPTDEALRQAAGECDRILDGRLPPWAALKIERHRPGLWRARAGVPTTRRSGPIVLAEGFGPTPSEATVTARDGLSTLGGETLR